MLTPRSPSSLSATAPSVTALSVAALTVVALVLALFGSGVASAQTDTENTTTTPTTEAAGTPTTEAEAGTAENTATTATTPTTEAAAAQSTVTTVATEAGATSTTASDQTSRTGVPCEVAMVVGCISSDGTTTAGVTGETGAAVITIATRLEEGERPDDRPLQGGLDPWERGGLRTNFGTDSIPLSHYQIGADVTGWLDVPDPLDSFVASQTNWAFTTTTFLVILATNAMQWAFEFPLAEDLVGEAGVLAQTYTLDLFGFGLSTSVYGLALSITMLVAGFKAVTKGVVVAGSEVLLAFVAYVILIALTMTSSFGEVGLRVASLSSDVSSSIAAFAAGQDRQAECSLQLGADPETTPSVAGAAATTSADQANPAASSSACTFGFAVQRSLVELPYQNLQWGQVLDGVEGKEECAAINRTLLAEGPWGNSDEPRDRMRAVSACEENADFNHQASYIRLGVASANAVSAGAVTVLILIVAAMLLWQQVKLLFLTVTLPHALVFAILPGRSRKVAWQWLEHLAGVVIRTVVLALGLVVWLSLFSLVVYEQLTFRGIFLSFFASVAMAVGGFYGLYRLSGLTRRLNPAAPRVIQGDADDTDSGSDGSGGGSGGSGGGEGSGRGAQIANSTLRTVRRRTTGSTPSVGIGSGSGGDGSGRRLETVGGR